MVDVDLGYSGDSNGFVGSGAGEGYCGDWDSYVVCGSCRYSWVLGIPNTPSVCGFCRSCGVCGCCGICEICGVQLLRSTLKV